MDACANHGKDKFGDDVWGARQVLVLAKATRHAKKLLTASDIYLSMLLETPPNQASTAQGKPG